jgi:hypothetical protein
MEGLFLQNLQLNHTKRTAQRQFGHAKKIKDGGPNMTRCLAALALFLSIKSYFSMQQCRLKAPDIRF